MWIPLQFKHDTNFLRIVEEPLVNRVAERLNDIEHEHGSIKYVIEVSNKDNNYISIAVQVDN